MENNNIENNNQVDDKPKKKGKKWLWITLGIIVVIIVISMVSSSSSNKNKTATTVGNNNSNVTQEKSTTTNKEFYSIGEEAILNSMSVIVTKVEKSNGSEYNRPKDGMEFVLVSITLKNNGASNLSYNTYDFKMQNSQGQILDTTFYTGEENLLHYGELAPNGTISAKLAYEQPKNDSDLTLIYKNSILSSKELKIKLQ